MSEMSPGKAMRNLQQADAGLRKARRWMKKTRGDARATPEVIRAGWESLVQAHRLMAEIPLSAVDDAVLTKQLSVQRYATALLVRIRRLTHDKDPGAEPDEDD